MKGRGQMAREYIKLNYGQVYTLRSGGEYKCLTPMWLPYPAGEERLQNIMTGWTFRAYGVTVHPDGTIEWDYSAGGYFA